MSIHDYKYSLLTNTCCPDATALRLSRYVLTATSWVVVHRVEMLTAFIQDEISIVQASLLGSILANLLLILGMGFLLGGLRYREQVRLPWED